jgi:hypothetical protein
MQKEIFHDIAIKNVRRGKDLSSWREADISRLSTRNKKRYRKRKAAIITYFTTAMPLDKISIHLHIPTEQLLQLARQCLMLHEDGSVWGFRALVPGVQVIDCVDNPPMQAEDPISKIDHEPGEEDCSMEEPLTIGNTVGEDHNSDKVTGQSSSVEVCESEHAAEQVEDISITDEIVAIEDVPDDEALLTIDEGITEKRSEALTSDDDGQETGTFLAVGDGRRQQRRFFRPRRVIHLRRQRTTRQRRHASGRVRLLSIVSGVMLAVMLLVALIPLALGLMAYDIYSNVNGLARSGVNHLLAVKAMLPSSAQDPLVALDANKLRQAQQEFRGAESDFTQLESLVNRPDVQTLVQQVAPEYASKLVMAQHLVRVALDVSHMGDEMSGVGITAAGIVHSSPLASNSAKPLISVADVTAVQGAMIHALYYIDDISTQMRQVDMRALPISAKQQAQLTGALALLPHVRSQIVAAQRLVGAVAWLLGVGHARRFLIQTMDRAELRPGGGFTGQYGILQIQDGRMAPFSLRDVALLDYAGNGMELGRAAPPEYSNWMNFGNWGLRDSNLSGDYPITAQMSMRVFEEEGGGPVDGDIAFTPTFIGHILDVTGPIYVADYHETITSKNLEERLHYYQQDYNAIALQEQKTNNDSHAVRKTFTTLVGKLLLDRVRHLPTKQLVTILKNAVKDIQARDLEIYFTDPQAEQWLVNHGYSGGMDTFQRQDGFMLVQANISISKASQYVRTSEQDQIVLDVAGGATHNLTITLNYQQTGPVYGYDTYADYMRLYAAQTSQLLGGHGFDSGQCYNSGNGKNCCTASVTKPSSGSGQPKGDNPAPPKSNDCAQFQHSFPDDARYCPDGNYDLGIRGGINKPWPIDKLSGPTALQSDLQGRAMWGGLTVTPKNCISTITLSWYVPHAVKISGEHATYTLLIQKQGGYIPSVQITIDGSALKMKPLNFQGDLVADKMLSVSSGGK